MEKISKLTIAELTPSSLGYECPTCGCHVPIEGHGIYVVQSCEECMTILKEVIKERRILNQTKQTMNELFKDLIANLKANDVSKMDLTYMIQEKIISDIQSVIGFLPPLCTITKTKGGKIMFNWKGSKAFDTFVKSLPKTSGETVTKSNEGIADEDLTAIGIQLVFHSDRTIMLINDQSLYNRYLAVI